MFEPFVGTIMFHPAALEYSGNSCTNNCAYCFANINKEKRCSKIGSAINQIRHNDKEPESFPAILLKCGYPICISNRSDPFAASNREDTKALFSHLMQINNGIFIQTKGGAGVDDVLSIIQGRKRVVWYITITTLDDGISRRIEPGAPVSSERMALAVKLRALGYMVIIAVNPCQREWMPEPEMKRLMAWMDGNGLKHICLEVLHISRLMKKQMTVKETAALGESVVAVANSPEEFKHVRDMTEMLVESGLSVAKKGMPFYTTFFDDIRAEFKIQFPVYQDFINNLFSVPGHNKGLTATFDDFWRVVGQETLFGVMFKKNYIRQYLLRSSMRVWKDHKFVGSFKNLLRLMWNDKRLNNSIQRHCLFSTAGTDANGDALLHFTGRIQHLKGGGDSHED